MLTRPTILPEHIIREKSSKTVCVTACLTAIGIPVTAFTVTSTKKDVHAFKGVVRRNGYAVRSRKSYMPKGASVGKCRKAIAKLNDPVGTLYMILVPRHLLLVNAAGETVVDTAPRKRDKRKVDGIYAVFPK